MDTVKHFKVVSSLPTELEKNSIYYVRVGDGFDIYLTNNLGIIAAKPLNQSQVSEAPKTFEFEVFKRGNSSGGVFYDRIRAGSHISSTGSWNGWSSANPFVIPFNCKITKALIAFKESTFNWRSTSGNIFLDIGFIDHGHNTTLNERILRFEIDGNFINNTTGVSTHKYIITSDNITVMSGSNNFNEGEIIGLLLRTANSVPGRINNIENAYHKIILEEI